jgi:hypothetical protein
LVGWSLVMRRQSSSAASSWRWLTTGVWRPPRTGPLGGC